MNITCVRRRVHPFRTPLRSLYHRTHFCVLLVIHCCRQQLPIDHWEVLSLQAFTARSDSDSITATMASVVTSRPFDFQRLPHELQHMIIREVVNDLIRRQYPYFHTHAAKFKAELRQVIGPLLRLRNQNLARMLVPVLKSFLPDLEWFEARMKVLSLELHQAMRNKLWSLKTGIKCDNCHLGRCGCCLMEYYGDINQTSLAAFFGDSTPHWAEEFGETWFHALPGYNDFTEEELHEKERIKEVKKARAIDIHGDA